MRLCHIGLAIWTALSQHSRRTRCHQTLEAANAVLCHWSPMTGNELWPVIETADSLHSDQCAMLACVPIAEACRHQACLMKALQNYSYLLLTVTEMLEACTPDLLNLLASVGMPLDSSTWWKHSDVSMKGNLLQ